MEDEKFRLYIGCAPKDAVRESERERKAITEKSRARLIEESQNTQFAYYCALCLIIRDENDYLEEWLRWHIDIGVEHFYIYDHGSKEPVKDFIRGLGGDIAEKTEIIDWSGRHKDAQPDAYNDCLKRSRGVSRWVGFVDTDEHVCVKTGQSLPEFLKSYEDFAGLFAIWVTYGANGRVEKTNEPLRRRFTKISHGDTWAENVGKLIAQPVYTTDIMIHNGRAANGFDIVDEHCRKINDYILRTDNPTRDFVCVDHYYTKSYEEWMEKLKRGSSHSNFARRYEEFFKVNPDMEYCKEKTDVRQEYERF